MSVCIRPAALDELDLICRLRLQRAAWLAARGSDQWSTGARGLSIDHFARVVDQALGAGETWIAEYSGVPAGTITVNTRADSDLWTRDELADALIVHYLIVDLRFAGCGIGHTLLAHAAALTRLHRRHWVRLDAWTNNADLHAYYRHAGFRLVRFAIPTHTSPSCALFERHIDSWGSTTGQRATASVSFPSAPLPAYGRVVPIQHSAALRCGRHPHRAEWLERPERIERSERIEVGDMHHLDTAAAGDESATPGR